MRATFETKTKELREKIINDDLQLCITNGNRKLGKIPGISFAPLLTCDGMRLDCWNQGCYSKWYFRFSPNPWFSIMQNTLLIHEAPNRFFRELYEWLEINKPEYFRWFIVGDIPDIPFVINRIRLVAGAFPGTRFMGFTKRFDLLPAIVVEAFPENLVILKSYWIGQDIKCHEDTYPYRSLVVKKGFTDVHTVEIPNIYDAFGVECPTKYAICPNNCQICKVCWEPPSDDLIVILEKHGSGNYKRKKKSEDPNGTI